MSDDFAVVREAFDAVMTQGPIVDAKLTAAEKALDRIEARAVEREADLRQMGLARQERDQARADAERLAEAADDYLASRRIDAKERLLAALAAHE